MRITDFKVYKSNCKFVETEVNLINLTLSCLVKVVCFVFSSNGVPYVASSSELSYVDCTFR